MRRQNYQSQKGKGLDLWNFSKREFVWDQNNYWGCHEGHMVLRICSPRILLHFPRKRALQFRSGIPWGPNPTNNPTCIRGPARSSSIDSSPIRFGIRLGSELNQVRIYTYLLVYLLLSTSLGFERKPDLGFQISGKRRTPRRFRKIISCSSDTDRRLEFSISL